MTQTMILNMTDDNYIYSDSKSFVIFTLSLK